MGKKVLGDWRRELALAYCPGSLLYTDDGELQDNRVHPPIDFLRYSPSAIGRVIRERSTPKATEDHTKAEILVTLAHAIDNLTSLAKRLEHNVEAFREICDEVASLNAVRSLIQQGEKHEHCHHQAGR